MQLKRIILGALLFQISLFGYSQQDTLLIIPGSGLLDGSVIEPYTNKWKVTLVKPDGEKGPNKIWTDYGQIIELEGKQYFHRVQDLYDPQMNLLDTWINMTEHKSLLPVSFSTLRPDGKFSHYQYSENIVSGRNTLNPRDSLVVKEIDFGQKVYDWNLYGMLLVGLPFKKGLIAKIPFSGPSSLQWLIAHVTDKETFTLPNNSKISTWKVVTNQNLTFWISESAPYVIKLDLKLATGAKLVWEVI